MYYLRTSSPSLAREILLLFPLYPLWGFPGGSEGKASACNAGDLGSIPGSGRSPREGNGNPLKYSCLKNPTDRETWSTTAHGIAKSRTRLSDFTFFLSFLVDYSPWDLKESDVTERLHFLSFFSFTLYRYRHAQSRSRANS